MKQLTVSRSELAVMLGITEHTANTRLNPATNEKYLSVEFRAFREKHGGLPCTLINPIVPFGQRSYVYPAALYFPLCRWPDVKKLADTRPDVVGEYVNWIDEEAHKLPLLWSGE